eukprot:CAMPEP_0118964072 /NCGR_PEP_ID=MMETSP1173-20130426/1841_1 /TAXON_ID=1034831 /ORGANISM="Rhizochromulina marina cf, Strain CCMP1243" /LENGTH=222 /DNA_ID=CAMNT_0006912493 /DNA_START=115 /DNA_END=783 /DNA_ORIENTATION=+
MDTSPEYFSHRVCVQAAAHICLALGFERTYPAVLDTIADVIKHYVETIGSHAHAITEHGGRQDVTAIDIIAAMKQLSPHPVNWQELRRFAFNEQGSWQQPFHAEIVRYPLHKRPRDHYAGVEEGASERPAHIPAFLPPLPPPHTHQRTAVPAVVSEKNAKSVREKRLKRKQQYRESLADMEGQVDKGGSSRSTNKEGGNGTASQPHFGEEESPGSHKAQQKE